MNEEPNVIAYRRIDDLGRIQIPQSIRKALDVEYGDEFRIELVGRQLRIVRIERIPRDKCDTCSWGYSNGHTQDCQPEDNPTCALAQLARDGYKCWRPR